MVPPLLIINSQQNTTNRLEFKAKTGSPQRVFFVGKGGMAKRSYGNCLRFSASSVVNDDAGKGDEQHRQPSPRNRDARGDLPGITLK